MLAQAMLFIMLAVPADTCHCPNRHVVTHKPGITRRYVQPKVVTVHDTLREVREIPMSQPVVVNNYQDQHKHHWISKLFLPAAILGAAVIISHNSDEDIDIYSSTSITNTPPIIPPCNPPCPKKKHHKK